MKYIVRPDESVKREKDNSELRAQLLPKIEAQIQAANDAASELELYAMWLRHGLVPAAHICALMNAEGGVQ